MAGVEVIAQEFRDLFITMMAIATITNLREKLHCRLWR